LDAIEALTTRASPLALTEPAPDAGALAAMLRAGSRAPDHGKLKPWRFIVIAGNARSAFGDVLAEALRKREPELPESAIDKERGKPLRAPLIVVVAARLREHKKVPVVEQIVAAGAAAQNILVAAHALGFGGFWRTGRCDHRIPLPGHARCASAATGTVQPRRAGCALDRAARSRCRPLSAPTILSYRPSAARRSGPDNNPDSCS
jgi:hypothetical protein